MVNLMLDDLRCPAGEGLEPCLEFFILPLYLSEKSQGLYTEAGYKGLALKAFKIVASQ